jgi:hypothetical protein
MAAGVGKLSLVHQQQQGQHRHGSMMLTNAACHDH